MSVPQKGDFVSRRSYGCDLIFEVVGYCGPERVLLKAVTTRLLADSPVGDLVRVPHATAAKAVALMEQAVTMHASPLTTK